MGNRFSRRRDVPITTEGSASEQKAAETETTTTAGDDPGPAQTQEAGGIGEVVVGEAAAPVARLPAEECVSECKADEAPAASDPLGAAEPKEEAPVPVQAEPLISVEEPSPVEAEAVAEPEPVKEVPEPLPEPEPASKPEEAAPEPAPEPEPEPAPAEEPEQQTDPLVQETLPEPALPSPPLIDLAAPDVAPPPMDASPSPSPVPDPVAADQPSDVTAGGEEEEAEAATETASEPEKPEETSESAEKAEEAAAEEMLEQNVNDVSVESVSGLLKGLELTGNDLATELIHSDVKIPDDTPIGDTSISAELM